MSWLLAALTWACVPRLGDCRACWEWRPTTRRIALCVPEPRLRLKKEALCDPVDPDPVFFKLVGDP